MQVHKPQFPYLCNGIITSSIKGPVKAFENIEVCTNQNMGIISPVYTWLQSSSASAPLHWTLLHTLKTPEQQVYVGYAFSNHSRVCFRFSACLLSEAF